MSAENPGLVSGSQRSSGFGVLVTLLGLTVAAFLSVAAVPGAHGAAHGSPGGAATRAQEAYGRLPLSFEVNQGQAGSQVRFLSHGDHHALMLEDRAAVLTVGASIGPAESRSPSDGASKLPSMQVRMEAVGGNPQPRVEGVDRLEGVSNYLVGNDPSRWHTGVPTYAGVRYHDLYPGVDLVYHGDQRDLEYDLVVAPGADPAVIMLAFAGQDRLTITPAGDLTLASASGSIIQRRPLIYQEDGGTRRVVGGGYRMPAPDRVAFTVAGYDATKPLVIDPVLAYSTYLGGRNHDYGRAIAVDALGQAYVTGGTLSSDFPTTNGSQQRGHVNAFVSKLNPAGSGLIYSTYLGGNAADEGAAIAADDTGSAYLTGYTESLDFPTFPNPGAFQPTHGRHNCASGTQNCDSYAFVTKLTSTGVMAYSSYLGGPGGLTIPPGTLPSSANLSFQDQGLGIALDAARDVVLTGETSSQDFPITRGAFQPTNGNPSATNGGPNAFVTKMRLAGQGAQDLLYSTYLGGSSDAGGKAIAVDPSGAAYVTGYVNHSSTAEARPFPTTLGAFQRAPQGDIDAFVAKLELRGRGPLDLAYSTLLGGRGCQDGLGVAVDASGSAYVTGHTSRTACHAVVAHAESTFPVVNALQATNLSTTFQASNAFVTKLNPSGSQLIYSTYLGGTGNEQGLGIAVDPALTVYVTGSTTSPSFPGNSPSPQNTYRLDRGGAPGTPHAFVARLDAGGTTLVFATTLGGSIGDDAAGIAVEAAGAYVTGATFSPDFPTTASDGARPLQGASGGGTCPGSGAMDHCSDAFIAKIPLPHVTGLSPVTGLPGGGTAVTVNGSGFAEVRAVDFGGTQIATPCPGGTGASSVPCLTAISPDQLLAYSPAHAVGAVDVTVETPWGRSPANPPADVFTYALPITQPPAPTALKLTPQCGAPAGGDRVTIVGSGFVAGSTTVTFDTSPALNVQVATTTTLTATTPAHAAGRGIPVTVGLSTAPGTSKPLPFEYSVQCVAGALASPSPSPSPTPTPLSGSLQSTLTPGGQPGASPQGPAPLSPPSAGPPGGSPPTALPPSATGGYPPIGAPAAITAPAPVTGPAPITAPAPVTGPAPVTVGHAPAPAPPAVRVSAPFGVTSTNVVVVGARGPYLLDDAAPQEGYSMVRHRGDSAPVGISLGAAGLLMGCAVLAVRRRPAPRRCAAVRRA